jgi:hypothetical protein
MTEKPCSASGPEPPKSDSVMPQRPVEAPHRQAGAEQITKKPWLDKILLGLAFAAVLVFVLLRLPVGTSWIVNIIASLVLAAFCALIFKLASYLIELLTVILAMWLPLGVTAIAGVLLFYEGQGRDLGVGLLGQGQLKLIMLFLILIYWAMNNWHSARLGLNYAFPSPTGTERWLYWPPRLLGVCAHFFAAMSLALASWGLTAVTDAGSSRLKPLDFLVFTAPVAIVLVALFMWAFDVRVLSRRQKKPVGPRTALWLMSISLSLVIALFSGLYYASSKEWLPEGLVPGTAWISASAFVFLLVIIVERRSCVQVLISHDQFSISLALIGLFVGVLIWWSPIVVGDFLGSLNVCFFAFGAALATLNSFGRVARFFIDTSTRAGRVKLAALSFAFLGMLAAGTSLQRDFHRVRLCSTEACSAAPAFTAWSAIKTIEGRPTVKEAALAWYDQAEQLYHKNGAHKDRPVPMLVIATAGGGIRAAFWTATVIEQLQADLQKKNEPLQNLIFAISGVSGGSVGAMNYIAALHAREALGQDVRPTDFLQSDFLAPAIASLVFVDGPSNFLPDLGQIDRGTALERSFENGSKGYLSYSFLSFFPDKETSKRIWRPALLLNATHQETGRRIIASNIKIERHVFLDSFDEFNLLKSDMRASTVAHNSARFTYVSPAGKLVSQESSLLSSESKNRGYVIDGGYFENYGALTALELVRQARLEIEKEKGKEKVKLVILQISSDPTLTKERTRVRTIENADEECLLTTANAVQVPNGTGSYLSFKDSGFDPNTRRWQKNDGEGWVVSYLNELTAPLIGVTAVREAHGTLAAAELASAVCAEQEASKTPAPQISPKQGPAPLNDLLIAGSASRDSNSVQASTTTASDSARSGAEPLFAHLAMCEVSETGEAPIVAPLGWALSKPMREKFPKIIGDCGNRAELDRLEEGLN